MSPEEWRQQQEQPAEQTLSPQDWATEQAKQTSNPLMAFAKSAAEKVVPTATGLAMGVPGAVSGAAMLSPLGPAGMVAGGLMGGFGMGGLGSMAGQAIQTQVGEQFSEEKQQLGFGESQRAAERAAFPTASKLGEYAPDVASLAVPTKVFEKGVMSFMGKRLWDESSPAQKAAWAEAENLGLKLKPTQLQESNRAMILSDPRNQKIVNQEAAKATGYEGIVSHVDEKFLTSRFDDLSKQYDRVYKDPSLGKTITLDPEINVLFRNTLANKEVPLPSTVNLRMNKMLDDMQLGNKVDGEDFRYVMSELKRAARSTTDGNQRYAIYDIVHDLNESLGRNNPQVAAILQDLNPKYRATATLDTAFSKGVIERTGNLDAYELGKMLKSSGKEQSNPLYKLGEVGELLGISSVGKAPKQRNADTQKDVYIPGVSWMLRLANKVGRTVPESSASANLQRRVMQEAEQVGPQQPKTLADALRASVTRSGPLTYQGVQEWRGREEQ